MTGDPQVHVLVVANRTASTPAMLAAGGDVRSLNAGPSAADTIHAVPHAVGPAAMAGFGSY